MESLSPRHAERTQEDFAGLVSDRVLPLDLINKVIVLVQGALWKHRMIRDSSRKESEPNQGTSSTLAVESRILSHLLGMHRVLLEVGLEQLAEEPSEDTAPNNLALRITATFRRTLPALRIASKWLRANFKYVMRCQTPKDAMAVLSKEDASALWSAYARFAAALTRHFPTDQLPTMTGPLEEDIEMRGFLPLKGLMIGEPKDSAVLDGKLHVPLPQQINPQVHPNEEQLMRIADLLADARTLAAMDVGGVTLSLKIFADIYDQNAPQVLRRSHNGKMVDGLPSRLAGGDTDFDRVQDQDDDALTEATSHDDPVGDAFRKVLSGSVGDVEEEEDEQEDEIVWNPAYADHCTCRTEV